MAIPAIPRLIRPTHPAPILKAIGRLLLFAVIASTIVLWAALLHEGFLRIIGREVAASLISIHERRSSSGAYSHLGRYRYTLSGPSEEQIDESSISWSAWHRLSKPFITNSGLPSDITLPTTVPVEWREPVGELGVPGPATIQVRAYAVGPWVYSRAVEHEWAFMFLLIPALFAPLMTLLSWTLYLALIIRPRRQRRLYTHGAAITGMITGQRKVRVKHGELLFADYSYAPAGHPSLLYGTAMLAGPKEYESALPGKAVLVLYNPEKPRESAIYDYGGYAWE